MSCPQPLNDAEAGPAETVDAFWGGAVRVIQKKGGYRFSVDAVLLAWFVEPRPQARCLDLGTGAGIIPLLLLRSAKCRMAVGLEIQKDLAVMALRNARLNRFDERFHVIRGDIRRAGGLLHGARFDIVVANPPYRELAAGKRSPIKEKEIARHEVLVTLSDVVGAGTCRLAPGGAFYLIHLPKRLEQIRDLLEAHRCHCQVIRYVKPGQDSPPGLMLIKAVRGDSRRQPTMLAPVALHDEEGRYTPEAQRILRPDLFGTLR